MANEPTIRWVDPLSCDDMRLSGFAFINENKDYHRLSNREQARIKKANPEVWRLSTHTSGGQLHFSTTSDRVIIKATIGHFEDVAAMSAIGRGGFDLCAGKTYQAQKCLGTTRFDPQTNNIEHTFDLSVFDKAAVTIDFPLYAPVESLTIGLDENTYLDTFNPYKSNTKGLIYGTSITQGAFVARPGLSFVNILSRMQMREWYNFGFSGNGLGEEDVIDVITDINDADVFIIDYEANAGTVGKLETTLENIITDIRHKHSAMDIIVLSRIPYVYDELDPVKGKRRKELKVFQRDMVTKHRLAGDAHIFFVDGSSFFGSDYDKWMVDTVHPNDIGHRLIAEGIHKHMKTTS